MKKRMHVLCLFVFFISGLFFVPAINSDNDSKQILDITESKMTESEYVPRNIRVAIYDESNITPPVYQTYPGIPHNNATGLRDVLEGYGYQVTLLDVNDIYNYELKTADYDVFCLIDNQPREKIVYRIMDFWLGGGGLLSFDGSSGFLCSFGILPPESEGSGGYDTYWRYFSDDINITARHPIAQEYPLNYIIDLPLGTFAWNYTTLQTTSIADDITMVGKSPVFGERAPLLAYDPSDRGGRVVTIGDDLNDEYIPDLEPIINDAVDWLAPRPKARILYDLSHTPWVPTDPWEDSPNLVYLSPWRDALVSRAFTIDKLHPSTEGNYTAENLAPYDMLVVNQPGVSFTTQEIQAVEDWVQNGGGLFVVGDGVGVPDNYRLNELISPYGIQFNHTLPAEIGTFSNFEMHPTTEDCTDLYYAVSCNLNISGNAYPIWNYTSTDIAVAASELGEGRIIVVPDANSLLESWIVLDDNYRFLVNVANWLTTSQTRILVYHDYPATPYNYYKSPIALALNDLGLDFMLTFRALYFNLSLNLQDWDLIIYDANSVSPTPTQPVLIEHLENGGKLLMRDLAFRFPDGYLSEDYPLWGYLGFNGRGPEARITDGPPPVYFWEIYHTLFKRPVDFGTDYIDSALNYYVTDWTSVMLYENATALAGISPSQGENMSAIIECANGQAICNMFSISQYYDDTDDSTYSDNYELWLNEIAYIMRPTIEDPGNLVFEIQGPEGGFYWTAHSYAPGDYQVKRDSAIINTQVWDGSPIFVSISGLAVGTYEFQLTVRDHVAYRADDYINVTIEDHIAPDWIIGPTDELLRPGEPFSQQLSASDPSGIGGWYVNDTTNFDITLTGLLTNNTILELGDYGLSVSVEDSFGNIRDYSIRIRVYPSTTTTVSSPTTTTPSIAPTSEPTSSTSTSTPTGGPVDNTVIIIILIVAGAGLIIIVIIVMKKRGG